MKVKYLIVLFLLATLTSCNKESYIESVGKVTASTGDEQKVSHFIFTSKGAVNLCGSVQIYVDDILLGTLKEENVQNIDCKTGGIQDKILHIVVDYGTHSIKVVYKDNCKPTVTVSKSLNPGQCFWYTII